MRVMFDTNVLISLAMFPNERNDKIVNYIIRNHTLVLSDLVVEEFLEVSAYKKFNRVVAAKALLEKLSYEIYITPPVMHVVGLRIRDDEDYAILFSAVKSDVDVFITGDKDFFDCGVSRPKMMTITAFESEYDTQ